MRILFISPSLKNGGAEHMIGFVSRACASTGFDCLLYAVGFGKNEVPFDEKVRVYTSKYDGNQKKLIPKRAHEISSIIREEKVDMICAFTPHPVKLAVLANMRHHLPIIASERDNPYAWGFLRKMINNFFYNRCSCIVYQVEGARNAFRGMARRNGIVIPNPVLNKVAESVTSGSNTVFLAGGALTARKNFPMLIEAFSIFHKNHDAFTLLIYGDGEDKEKLSDLIRSLNLSNSVFLMGWKKDFVTSYAEKSFCFVLSSDNEGMPNVLIEAMANGIPCISTDTQPGGPRFLLDDGKNGLLVPVGDSKAMSEALSWMVENVQERTAMAERAFDKLNNLSRAEIERKWIDCFVQWGQKNE